MPDQRAKNIPLGFREMDHRAILFQRRLREVDREAPDFQLFAEANDLAQPHPAKVSANTRLKLRGVERLGDVIVGASVEERDFLAIGVTRRSKD